MADDSQFFGPQLVAALEQGAARGLLRHKNGAWFSRDTEFPAGKIGLRSTAGGQFTVVEEETGDIVGTEGAETAFSALHPGAVYLHMGDTYLVTSLDLEEPHGPGPALLGHVPHRPAARDRHPHHQRDLRDLTWLASLCTSARSP